MAEKKTYTVVETAKVLGITKDRAYKLIHSGVLRGFKCGRTLVSEYAINEFLQTYAGCDVSNPASIKQLK